MRWMACGRGSVSGAGISGVISFLLFCLCLVVFVSRAFVSSRQAMFPLMRFLERVCGRTFRPSCILIAGKNTSSYLCRVVDGIPSRVSVRSCEGDCRHNRRPLNVALPFLAVHENGLHLIAMVVGGGKGTRGC